MKHSMGLLRDEMSQSERKTKISELLCIRRMRSSINPSDSYSFSTGHKTASRTLEMADSLFSKNSGKFEKSGLDLLWEMKRTLEERESGFELELVKQVKKYGYLIESRNEMTEEECSFIEKEPKIFDFVEESNSGPEGEQEGMRKQLAAFMKNVTFFCSEEQVSRLFSRSKLTKCIVDRLGDLDSLVLVSNLISNNTEMCGVIVRLGWREKVYEMVCTREHRRDEEVYRWFMFMVCMYLTYCEETLGVEDHICIQVVIEFMDNFALETLNSTWILSVFRAISNKNVVMGEASGVVREFFCSFTSCFNRSSMNNRMILLLTNLIRVVRYEVRRVLFSECGLLEAMVERMEDMDNGDTCVVYDMIDELKNEDVDWWIRPLLDKTLHTLTHTNSNYHLVFMCTNYLKTYLSMVSLEEVEGMVDGGKKVVDAMFINMRKFEDDSLTFVSLVCLSLLFHLMMTIDDDRCVSHFNEYYAEDAKSLSLHSSRRISETAYSIIVEYDRS